MIPKRIHYCWISGEENMPDDIKTCVDSWKEFLPDYQFTNWNDSNFDWNLCDFTKYCRENEMWAFCADFVRYWALYNYGGFYLDCDVMIYKSFDELTKLKRLITTEYVVDDRIEAAILGAEKGDTLFKQIMDFYLATDMRPYEESMMLAPDVMVDVISQNGYILHDIDTIKRETKKDKQVNILDVNKFFSRNNITEKTFAVHQFKNTWVR